MDTTLKQVRSWLNSSTKTELDHIVEEAMLNDRQREITYLRRKGCSNQSIAFKLHCDVGTINKDVRRIYKLIGRVIL